MDNCWQNIFKMITMLLLSHDYGYQFKDGPYNTLYQQNNWSGLFGNQLRNIMCVLVTVQSIINKLKLKDILLPGHLWFRRTMYATRVKLNRKTITKWCHLQTPYNVLTFMLWSLWIFCYLYFNTLIQFINDPVLMLLCQYSISYVQLRPKYS